MKRTVATLFVLFIFSGKLYSQVYLKGEFIGSSAYRDEENKKVGNSKGSAQIYQGGINVPFGIKLDENERPTAWGISLTGSYTALHNRNMPTRLAPLEIVNGQLSLSYIRPFREKWSVMAVAGIGIYTADAKLSRLSMKNVLGHGGVVFIYHWKPNLDIGGGLAVNTSFGYPMVFPAIYFAWQLEGKFEIDIQLMNAMEITAGMRITDYFKLKFVAEANGSLALEKVENKNMMFTHQYIVVGLQPEFRLGKAVSIPLTIGITADRAAYYEERTLKAFFKGFSREYDPHFSVAPYFAIGLKYGF